MRLIRSAWLTVLALGSTVITARSIEYFDTDLPEFVIEKLPLPREAVWLGALKIHVAAAALALPGCLVLVSKTALRRAPRFHRWVGRAIATVVLLALVPSGSYLALFAKGGLPSTAGFLVSGAIAAAAMVLAVREARARRFEEHRRYTLHVLGQLSVAVTSRAMLFSFDTLAFDPERAYLVALWLPVVASALAVELVVWRKHALPSRPSSLPARVRSA
ncbi:MAG TPA: DUF2306 domain-containing protein, partial [Myxococcales bacterium]|nr:DUF2306 domain-containing protein [Myxococcales bacterium]